MIINLVLLTLCLWIWKTNAIWLTLPNKDQRCVSEEIQKNVVVLGDYVVVADNPSISAPISVKVKSPYGNPLYFMKNVTHGQFAFTTKEAGNHIACFWETDLERSAEEVTVNLDWKIGIGAKDWGSVAKKEKLDGMELALRKLEGVVQDIHGNIVFLKLRVGDMREDSAVTNSKVAQFGMISLAVGIVASAFQVWHLTRFFRKKKII